LEAALFGSDLLQQQLSQCSNHGMHLLVVLL
jgi:hypothetical protein